MRLRISSRRTKHLVQDSYKIILARFARQLGFGRYAIRCRRIYAGAVSIIDEYENWVFDCDGTLYVGSEAVTGAADVVAAAHASSASVLFVTNDPTRTSTRLREHLARFGIRGDEGSILHAGRAAAMYAAEIGIESVLALGTPDLADTFVMAGIDAALTDALHGRADPVGVDGIVVGLKPTMVVEDLDLVLRNWRPGMPVLAANADRTYPGRLGPSLGSGSVAHAVAYALDIDVTPCGKPSPILYEEARKLLGAGRTAMVGDSLEADIAGANAAGWTSIWLNRDGAGVPDAPRPDHVIGDMRELLA